MHCAWWHRSAVNKWFSEGLGSYISAYPRTGGLALLHRVGLTQLSYAFIEGVFYLFGLFPKGKGRYRLPELDGGK